VERLPIRRHAVRRRLRPAEVRNFLGRAAVLVVPVLRTGGRAPEVPVVTVVNRAMTQHLPVIPALDRLGRCLIPRAGLAALVALLALAPVALASPEQVYIDCQDGRLERSYSEADLREALRGLPTDLDEYSNCREVIRSAQRGTRGPGGAGPSTGATGGYGLLPAGEGGLPQAPDGRPANPLDFSASPQERKEVEQLRRGIGVTGGPGLSDRASDREGLPAGIGTSPQAANGAELPAPLVVLLILTAAAIVAAAVPRLRRVVLRRSS
jgi:hypothetical protein